MVCGGPVRLDGAGYDVGRSTGRGGPDHGAADHQPRRRELRDVQGGLPGRRGAPQAAGVQERARLGRSPATPTTSASSSSSTPSSRLWSTPRGSSCTRPSSGPPATCPCRSSRCSSTSWTLRRSRRRPDRSGSSAAPQSPHGAAAPRFRAVDSRLRLDRIPVVRTSSSASWNTHCGRPVRGRPSIPRTRRRSRGMGTRSADDERHHRWPPLRRRRGRQDRAHVPDRPRRGGQGRLGHRGAGQELAPAPHHAPRTRRRSAP